MRSEISEPVFEAATQLHGNSSVEQKGLLNIHVLVVLVVLGKEAHKQAMKELYSVPFVRE
jgi:hypothetical protein